MKKLIFLFMAIIMVSNVLALGLAPAKTELDVGQGLKEGAFRIVSDNIPSKVLLTAEGDLGKYIELENDNLILKEHETWIRFKVNLPNTLPPGERKGNIIVLEVPKESGEDNIIMAATAVMHQVKVNVPYPGKYITGKMYITNTKVNEPIEFKIALKNFGIDKVENVKAAIVVKGPSNEEVGVFYSNIKSVMPGNEEVLEGFWQTENSGTYLAQATIEYDKNVFEINQLFNVGELELAIEEIKVNNFKLGQIAKLDIYLRNKWNKPLSVNGRVEIFKGDKLISSFNTLPVEIKEKSTAVMESYWNTEGIDVGEYDLSVKADYEGKTTEKTFTSIISIDEVKIKDYLSAKAASQKGSKNTTLLVTVVLLLIILNISLFIYINKRLKNTRY